VTEVLYRAPRTLTRFIESDEFVRCIIGPVGSGKSSMCVMEILIRAGAQAKGPDGIRRTRFAVIRNTYSQLRDTTRKTFEEWIPAESGTWHEQSFTFHIKRGDMDCEVLFRALDRPEDVKRLLSLELTGAYINEAREIPKHVLDVLQTRVGRYPSRAQGGATWFGIWMDTNPWWPGHWGAKLFAKLGKDEGYRVFRQPGGRDPKAENLGNLPPGYYGRLIAGKDREWIRVYVDGEDATADEGSIWGPWVAELEQRGGISTFDHPVTDIYTSWDLGRSDSTAIWFWRINAQRQVEVVDHYENHGQGLSHYFGVLDGKGYKYVKHWLPHDARHKTIGSDQSVEEQSVAALGRDKVLITPEMSILDGINAARWLFEQPVQIHERCDKPGRLDHSGLEALREYRFEWDEDTQAYSRTPLHNWASHTADAWRYMAVVVRYAERLTRPEAPAPPIDWERKPTFNDAVREYQRTSKGKARPYVPPEGAR
jgi:hypothetical protein